MRIIAGWLGGRNFVSPKAFRTHPMSEKMRGGLFGVLGDIKGLSVLDVFAGSGALSFEAISRGAKDILAIEVDKTAHQIINSNIESLNISDRVKVTKAYFNAWSTRNAKHKYDLVLADPPYDNLPYRDLKKLPVHLKDNGTLVLSWPSNMEELKLEGLNVVSVKNYGDGQLVFYKKVS